MIFLYLALWPYSPSVKNCEALSPGLSYFRSLSWEAWQTLAYREEQDTSPSVAGLGFTVDPGHLFISSLYPHPTYHLKSQPQCLSWASSPAVPSRGRLTSWITLSILKVVTLLCVAFDFQGATLSSMKQKEVLFLGLTSTPAKRALC